MQHPGKPNVLRVASLAAGARKAVDSSCRAADGSKGTFRPLLERVLLDHDPLLRVAALDLLFGLDQPCHQCPSPPDATAWIARSIFGYVPQRQRLPAIACLISSAPGFAFAASNAEAETICPGVQKPHWVASASTKASMSR